MPDPVITLIAIGPKGQLKTADGNFYLLDVAKICNERSRRDPSFALDYVENLCDLVEKANGHLRSRPKALLQVVGHARPGLLELRASWNERLVPDEALQMSERTFCLLRSLRGKLSALQLAGCRVGAGASCDRGLLPALSRVLSCDVAGATEDADPAQFDQSSGLYRGEMLRFQLSKSRCVRVAAALGASRFPIYPLRGAPNVSLQTLDYTYGHNEIQHRLSPAQARELMEKCSPVQRSGDGGCVVELRFSASVQTVDGQQYAADFEVMSNLAARLRPKGNEPLPKSLLSVRWEASRLLAEVQRRGHRP